MNKKRITKKEALELIEESKGRYFSVEFTKKDNSKRKLTGHVKKSNLINKMGYIKLRTWLTEEYKLIDVRTISELKLNKNTFKVK